MKTIKNINLDNNRTYIFIHIILVFFVFLCFRAGIDNFFAGDDFEWLFVTLKMISHPGYFITSQAYFVRHTEALYFIANSLLAGLNPISYQLTAILIHVVNVVLVSYLISRLCKNRFAGLLGALFWGVNYKHVEAVFRPYGVADSLALLFCLGAFFLFVRNQKTLATISFIIGLFAKENALIFPFIITLYVLFFMESRKKIWVKRTIPFWTMCLLFAGLEIYVKIGKPSYFTLNWGGFIRFWELMLSYVGLDAVYVKQVWLAEKSFLFPGWVPVVLFVVFGLIFWKLPKIYRFGLLWISIMMLPTVFVTYQTSRYHYIPLVGLGIIVGHGLNELLTYFWKKDVQKAIFGVFSAYVLVLGYYVIGINLEEQDYAFYGEIHRQATESFKQHILPTMPRDTDSMAVFFRPESGKWAGELFERNRLNPWYLPGTYKWVYVRPHAILGLTNTYSFVSYCTYNDVKDTLFVEVPYEEFRKKLLSGDFYIIIHNEETNTFEFGSDTLKAQLVKHINDKNFYSFLQPGRFLPMNKRRI